MAGSSILICTSSALWLLSVALSRLQEPGVMPWELIGSGSAALAVVAVVFVMLRHNSETMKALATEFAAAIKDGNEKNRQNVETFTQGATTLAREAREMLSMLLREQQRRTSQDGEP